MLEGFDIEQLITFEQLTTFEQLITFEQLTTFEQLIKNPTLTARFSFWIEIASVTPIKSYLLHQIVNCPKLQFFMSLLALEWF